MAANRSMTKLLKAFDAVNNKVTFDSDSTVTSASKGSNLGAGISTVTNVSDLPSVTQAYSKILVTGTNTLYQYSTGGWYPIAIINNFNPAFTTSPDATYALSLSGAATTVTVLATDSDDVPIKYITIADSDFNTFATISHDSDKHNVFTVIPIDSDGSNSGNKSGVVTFRASDGVNVSNANSTFTLTFITSVANSNYTRLLTKADSSSTDNQVDASTNSHTITESGSVISTAFSPYHPGGYSTYFDGTDDYITVTDSTDFDFGTGDFTMEGWYYFLGNTSSGDYYILNFTSSAGNGHFGVNMYNGGWRVGLFNGNLITDTTGIEVNAWHHFAWVRESGTMKFYIDGTQVGSDVSYSSALDCSGTFRIGTYATTPTYGEFLGYLRDIRIVKGTAVYTSAFTPPTESLTAITNTVLLACNVPYNVDVSASSHTLTPTTSGVGPGSSSTARFGPYDYEAYTKAEYGGSLDFQAASAYMAVDAGAITSSWGNNFTIEFWLHRDTLYDGYIFDNRIGGQTPGLYIRSQSSGVDLSMNGNLGVSGIGISADYLQKWAHYAFTFSGTQGKSFVNGKLTNTYTIADTASYAYHRAQNTIGAKQYTTRGDESLGQYKAKLADFRISTVLRYTTDFTPLTTAFVSDSDTLLLTCTNKNPIWDASTGKEWIQKGSGTVTVSNTQRKFTTSSAIQFTNGSGNYLYADLGETIGTRDFTIEAWVYTTSTTGQYAVQISNVAGVGYQSITSTNTQVGFGIQSGVWRHLTTGGYPLTGYVHTGVSATINTWHHVAQVRTGGSSKLYLNGTLISTNADTNNYSARYVAYGAGHLGYVWAGYMQDLRITLDHARYTSNFTPPTAELEG